MWRIAWNDFRKDIELSILFNQRERIMFNPVIVHVKAYVMVHVPRGACSPDRLRPRSAT